nr:WD repeat-containing protein 54-like [Lytechinus pictus]
MYHKSKSVHLKSSASLRYNNLSVLCSPERNVTCYAVVHKAVVNISNCAGDGAGSGVGPNVTQRQLHCKDVAGVTQNAAILEAKFCELPSRTLMVVCCQKGVQMFEPDSSALVFWHALFNSDGNDGFLFTRGIASVLDSFIAVGKFHAFSLCGNDLLYSDFLSISTGHVLPLKQATTKNETLFLYESGKFCHSLLKNTVIKMLR